MRRRTSGLTLVELLIGLTIGLFVSAGAAAWVATSLREQRASLLEARLMQDLRSAAEVVARDLRRSGYWGAAADGIWLPGSTGIAANPYSALAPLDAASDAAAFAYSRDAVENGAVDGNEQLGFRLRTGVIQMQMGGGWQAVTDVESLVVTVLRIEPDVQTVSLEAACPAACSASSVSCPPRVSVRSFALLIEGQAAHDLAVVRAVRSRVRLRNDEVVGACG